MFENVQTAPPDPILGLTEAFRQDPAPEKINLSVGVYVDDTGRTPVLETVKEAERRLLETEATKSYKPIPGDPLLGKLVRELVFGTDHPLVGSGRAVTAHTPGGTAALRIIGDYLHKLHPGATLWLSDPTWANHKNVYTAAGVPIRTYPYYDAETHGLDFEAMIEALGRAPERDAVLLHGCCHNPTGVDPTHEQWRRIGRLLAERGVLPIVDFAYQGLGDGLEDDAAGVRAFCEQAEEAVICSSFSKNFGLYNDRVGALTVIARDPDAAGAVFSQIKICIRSSYSNPPAHGGAIVATILSDADLRLRWEGEVAEMRRRINEVRRLFVSKLAEKGVRRDFAFLTEQRGMFSFSGLTKEQVQALRDRYSIYVVGSGRINVAGMTTANIDRLCEAIAEVLADQ